MGPPVCIDVHFTLIIAHQTDVSKPPHMHWHASLMQIYHIWLKVKLACILKIPQAKLITDREWVEWVSGWTCSCTGTSDSCQCHWVTGWQRCTNLHISPVVLAGITLLGVVTYSFPSALNFVRLFRPHSVSFLRLFPCTSSSTKPSASIFTASTVAPPGDQFRISVQQRPNSRSWVVV